MADIPLDGDCGSHAGDPETPGAAETARAFRPTLDAESVVLRAFLTSDGVPA